MRRLKTVDARAAATTQVIILGEHVQSLIEFVVQ